MARNNYVFSQSGCTLMVFLVSIASLTLLESKGDTYIAPPLIPVSALWFAKAVEYIDLGSLPVKNHQLSISQKLIAPTTGIPHPRTPSKMKYEKIRMAKPGQDLIGRNGTETCLLAQNFVYSNWFFF